MPSNTKQLVKNRSFSRYFYAGVNSFLDELYKAFNNDLMAKHLKKRVTKEIKKGCLTVSGYREYDNLVAPFSYMILVDNITEKTVYVKIIYEDNFCEEALETSFETSFDELSVETLLNVLKSKYF